MSFVLNSLEDPAMRLHNQELLIPSQPSSAMSWDESSAVYDSNRAQFQDDHFSSSEQDNILEPLPFKPQTTTQAVLSKPRKNLSPYNLFFQEERKVLLAELPTRKKGKPRKSHGKLGFQDMARIIASRWRIVDPWRLEGLKKRAAADKQRYVREMKAYKKGSSVTQTQVDPAVCALAKDLGREDIDFLLSALQ